MVAKPADAQRRLLTALTQIRATRDLTFELHAVQLPRRAAWRKGSGRRRVPIAMSC